MSRSDAEPEDWSMAIEVMRKMLRRLKESNRGGIENRFSIEDHLILVYDAHPLAVPYSFSSIVQLYHYTQTQMGFRPVLSKYPFHR